MNKRFMIIILMILCFCMSGCEKDNFIFRDVGKFVSIAPIPTTFNERTKSIVITTKGSFTIQGHASEVKGDKVCVGTKESTGKRYLFIGHQKYGKLLY